MTHEISRRAVLGALAVLPMAAHAKAPVSPPQVHLKALEATTGGRLGVAILDTEFGGIIGYRLDERFGMCSTFKLPLAAAVLQAAEQGRIKLDDIIAYTKADIVPHAPITEKHLDKGGMTVRDLAEAAQKTSDNVAANLLIMKLGGPAAVTAIWRGWGDRTTRIDRLEPEMNLVAPGEQRDTTSPYAMAQTMEAILTGTILKPESRDVLIQWMVDTKTGTKRIRGGLPAKWKAGDKTGTGFAKGQKNKYNDIAIAWPPRRKPIVVTAYFEANYEGDDIRDQDQAVLAEVGRIAAGWVS